MSSVVETLIYHGKLANQIVRLPAIVVKMLLPAPYSKVEVGGLGREGWGENREIAIL